MSNTIAESRAATEVPTARLGIWVFLASEVVIFGGLICCYVLYRVAHPEWGAEAAHTVTFAALSNATAALSKVQNVTPAVDLVDKAVYDFTLTYKDAADNDAKSVVHAGLRVVRTSCGRPVDARTSATWAEMCSMAGQPE